MVIVKFSVPEAITWLELFGETHTDTELSDLKEAIARGYDSIFTGLAVVEGLVVV